MPAFAGRAKQAKEEPENDDRDEDDEDDEKQEEGEEEEEEEGDYDEEEREDPAAERLPFYRGKSAGAGQGNRGLNPDDGWIQLGPGPRKAADPWTPPDDHVITAKVMVDCVATQSGWTHADLWYAVFHCIDSRAILDILAALPKEKSISFYVPDSTRLEIVRHLCSSSLPFEHSSLSFWRFGPDAPLLCLLGRRLPLPHLHFAVWF